MKRKRRSLLRRLLVWVMAAAAALYGMVALTLAALRFVNPPLTAVQVQKRAEAMIAGQPYRKRQKWVPLGRISPAFQHAVLAAEDSRFYQHHGFDWHEVRQVVEDGLENGRVRGASTITQQVVKNLYLTTWRSFVRKALEAPMVPLAEAILGKRRILELYLNVVEWGPGVFGAEAAARHYYGVPAARVTREQGARLAAVLPAPRRRNPARMDAYAARILDRMRAAGW